MKMGKVLLIGIVALLIHSVTVYAKDNFKDASPKIKSAVKDFNQRGILKNFVFKYGKTYFRPTTTVTREDMILTLYEYDRVVKTLIDYRSQLSSSMTNLKRRMKQLEGPSKKRKSESIDTKQLDLIVKEIQERLPVLLDNAPMPKKIQKRFEKIDRNVDLLELSLDSPDDKSISTSKLHQMIKEEVRRALKKDKRVRLTRSSPAPKSEKTYLSKLTISLGMLAAIFLAR